MQAHIAIKSSQQCQRLNKQKKNQKAKDKEQDLECSRHGKNTCIHPCKYDKYKNNRSAYCGFPKYHMDWTLWKDDMEVEPTRDQKEAKKEAKKEPRKDMNNLLFSLYADP